MSSNEVATSRPRSISIFLLHGDPDGIRVAHVAMSTIQAIAFRKLRLKDTISSFPELERPGVYLLLGFDELQPDQQIAYIGESGDVARRLKFHAGNAEAKKTKMFWTDTIALVSKDESLTKSHACYVEARLIADAGLNPRWKLRNDDKPPAAGKLPLPDRSAMEEFIEQAKTLVGALGFDIFRVVTGSLSGVNESQALVSEVPVIAAFLYKGDGFKAEMMVSQSREFYIKKGSIARPTPTPGAPKGIVKLREDLVAEGTLKLMEAGLVFTRDRLFTSVSSAAATVVGSAANGRVLWCLSDGRTYSQWEDSQNDAVADQMGNEETE